MKRLLGYLAFIILIFLLASGVFTELVAFATWLFMLQYSGPEISFFGEIIVRLLTFGVTYNLVWIIFETANLFNSKLMSFVYWVISTIAGFVLAYIVWTIEEHLLIIGVVLGIIAVLIITYHTVRAVVSAKKKNKNE